MNKIIFTYIAAVILASCTLQPEKPPAKGEAMQPTVHNFDPRCYEKGVFNPDLGADDLDCGNEGYPDGVVAIAIKDVCGQTAHDVQGKPPASFMRGIALSYARAVCHPNGESVRIAQQPLSDASKDALAHYGLASADAAKRLQSVYALLIGSAARESSWRWCVGRDMAASNATAETAEAGLYQTSFNSRSASPSLPALFNSFKASNQGCFSAEYKGKTTCSDSNVKNWGSGDGVAFQKLTKDCPGFASEYAAVMFRVNRKHYGPINTKKALVVPACVAMFEKIRQLIVSDPKICDSI